MISWILAAFIVGVVVGIWLCKKYFSRKDDSELTTEECVEYLKEKGYAVHLYGQNKEEKRGFR